MNARGEVVVADQHGDGDRSVLKVSVGSSRTWRWREPKTIGTYIDYAVGIDARGRATIVWDTHKLRAIAGGDGRGWTPPLVVVRPARTIFDPQIEVGRTGNATVLFAECVNEEQDVCSLRAVSRLARSWSRPQVIARASPSRRHPIYLDQLAIDRGGRPTALWLQGPPHAFRLMTASRLTSGDWKTAAVPSRTSFDPETFGAVARLDVDDTGNAIVAYINGRDDRLLVTRRPAAGSIWARPKLIATSGSTYEGLALAVAQSGAAVLVWAGGGGRLYAARGSAKTGVWEKPELIDPRGLTPNSDRAFPLAAISPSGRIVVVWPRDDGLWSSTYDAASGSTTTSSRLLVGEQGALENARMSDRAETNRRAVDTPPRAR